MVVVVALGMAVVVVLGMAWRMEKAYNTEEQNQTAVDRIVAVQSLVADTDRRIEASDKERIVVAVLEMASAGKTVYLVFAELQVEEDEGMHDFCSAEL